MPLGLEIRCRPAAEAPHASSFEASQIPRTPPEDDSDSLGESEGSRALSSDGPATPRTEAARPNRRSKTSFHLAHPPPSFINRQRLLIRPRLLLQLQRISESTRPSPALDVLPSTILPPRLARRFPAFFRGKDRLGPDDLVIVSSEDYKSSITVDSNYTEETDADISESRHVVATICQRRKEDGGAQGKADICLNDGPVWEAMPLSNGGYEFNATNDDGVRTTARWVCRPSPSRQRSDTGKRQVSHATGKGGKKLGFSLINPNVRRHPVIASLTRTSIEVFDNYPASVPSTTVHTPLITPENSTVAIPSMNSFFDPSLNLDLKQTDKDLRTLILVTGIWVAFCEGWCQGFKNQTPISLISRPASTAAATSSPSPRSASAPVTKELNSRSTQPESPLRPQSLETHVSRTKPPGLASTPEQKAEATPKRAHSTGAASGLRVDSRRHKVDHQDPQSFLNTLTGNSEALESVHKGPTFKPALNGASTDISVRSSVPRSIPERAQSVRVHVKDISPRDYIDSGREAQQTDAAAKKKLGRLRRLLSFVRKDSKDR